MMPTFLVIGAMKSGTTALWWYLRQHPDVFMPDAKEPHYFAFAGAPPRTRGPRSVADRAVRDHAAYERLFEAAGARHAVGEASPSSMYVPEACERIRREVPDARFIAVLRQPAERAYSSYLHLRRSGVETAPTFAQALELEPRRIADGWGYGAWLYRDLGYYGRQLERFYSAFPGGRIRVYLSEELSRDPVAVSRDAYAFLGVDPAFTPDTSLRPNVSGVPRGPLARIAFAWQTPLRSRLAAIVPAPVRKRIRNAVARRLLERPGLDPDLRARLTAGFADDIRLLATLTGRDLSRWLA